MSVVLRMGGTGMAEYADTKLRNQTFKRLKAQKPNKVGARSPAPRQAFEQSAGDPCAFPTDP